jgi:hypothetical protein
MNVISFSLWGDKPKYTVGAIRNAQLASIYYRGWRCRFYCDQETVPKDTVSSLQSLGNTDVILMKASEESHWSMFWRFYAASDPSVNMMVSRDCDSFLSARDAAAVDEWLDSGKKFHIMRDQYYHNVPIMGGMWGVRDRILLDMETLIKNYHRKESNNRKNIDQEFSSEIIYSRIRSHAFVHDTFDRTFRDRTKDFPIPRRAPFRELTLQNGDDNDYIGRVEGVTEEDFKKYEDRKYYNL